MKVTKTLALALFSTILLFSCTKEVIKEVIKDPIILPRPENNGELVIEQQDFNTTNSKEIFAEDEEDEIFFNRTIKVNQPLLITIDQNQNLKLEYYGPRTIKNVIIWAKLQGYPSEFKLATITTLPHFIEYTTPLPIVTQTKEYTTTEGKTIEIPANQYLSAADISLRIECEDPFYKKVTTMNSDLTITLGTFHTQGGNWSKLIPTHAREGIALLMNISYMFQTQRFADTINNHIFYSSNSEESLISNQTIIDKARRKGGKVNLGTTVGVNGLGGGNTLGVAEWQYVEHYADDKSIHHTVFHEYAHCMGYGHDGNMTYNSFGGDEGFVNLCDALYEEMSRTKELPVYSRRFLHTRRNRYTYEQQKYQASKHIIEDPELDLIDGGLDEKITIPDTDNPALGTGYNLTINHTNVPGATAETFTPKDACATANFIYVLNDAAENQSIEIFKVSGSKITHHKSIKSWEVEGEESTFAGTVTGIAVGGGFLYVSGVNSRIDLFNDTSFEYYTSIGTGSWGSSVNQTVHAYETVIKGDYTFIQDKQKVSIYKKEDILPYKRGNIGRVSQTSTMGDAFDVFGFDIDNSGKGFVSHAPSKKIYVYNFSSFRILNTISPLESWNMVTAVIDVACFNNRLVGVQKSKPFLVEINKENGELIKDFESVHSFGKLEKINVSNATLFGIDRDRKEVVAIPLTSLN